MLVLFIVLSFLVYLGSGQLAGTLQPEVHPPLSIQMCTNNGCSTVSSSVVLDSNWRWTHLNGVASNCYTGNLWNTTVCPDPITCATNCAVEGVNYQETYGITTNGDSLRLNFVTKGQYDTNIGSRVYLMADQEHYQMFQLLGNEFTFDVDVSQLPCGLNGALYFVEMAPDGGLNEFPYNKAGAQYGTGYCDAQCPQDLKWIDGVANLIDWNPSGNDPNSGSGLYGNCCHEMDIWEANSMDTAVTAHVCNKTGQVKCNGTACGDIGPNRYVGNCDRDGCDYNTYRLKNTTFYGPGSQYNVNTNNVVTVTTQFVTDKNQNLQEIRRFYIQNGNVIKQGKSTYPSLSSYTSLSDNFCSAEKNLFSDKNRFKQLGGMKEMGKSMQNGMVLVMSLWDDYAEHMLWLDSNYPTNRNPNTPGVGRGPCPITSGVPSEVQADYPNAYVVFSNIKFGPIGSTTNLDL